MPLCRRCHRTYHDFGLSSFDDETLGKALEIENRRREILYSALKEPTNPLQLLKREEVVRDRSDYWYKKHGLKRHPTIPRIATVRRVNEVVRRGIVPSCGWDWVYEHIEKVYPEQSITISNGQKSVTISAKDKNAKKAVVSFVEGLE